MEYLDSKERKSMKIKHLFTGLLAGLFLQFGFSNAKAEIVIGTAGPITGQHAAYGEQMRLGSTVAVEEINANGGLLGQKLRLAIQNDQCEPKYAQQAANKLISEGVSVVIGHFCSHTSLPASEIYYEENIIMITPGSTAVLLTERGFDNVFRFIGPDDEQGRVAADYILANFKGKRIAIAHDKQAYSQGLADEVKKNLNEAGFQEVLYDTITPKEQDYSALVTRLKAEKIDLVYYGGYHTEAAIITRQMREQGLKTILMSGDGSMNQEFWAITGEGGTGTLMTFGDPRNNPSAQEAIEKFRAKGYEPDGFTIYTYGALMTWAKAVEIAGTTDTEAVIAALRQNRFNTVIGEIGFNEKGNFDVTTYTVNVWENGTYRPIDQ